MSGEPTCIHSLNFHRAFSRCRTQCSLGAEAQRYTEQSASRGAFHLVGELDVPVEWHMDPCEVRHCAGGEGGHLRLCRIPSGNKRRCSLCWRERWDTKVLLMKANSMHEGVRPQKDTVFGVVRSTERGPIWGRDWWESEVVFLVLVQAMVWEEISHCEWDWGHLVSGLVQTQAPQSDTAMMGRGCHARLL